MKHRRHKDLPSEIRSLLASIRGRIAHGSANYETLELAKMNLPLLQRLCADALALAAGINPGAINFLEPLNNYISIPRRTNYDKDDNPITRWRAFLSDRILEYVRIYNS